MTIRKKANEYNSMVKITIGDGARMDAKRPARPLWSLRSDDRQLWKVRVDCPEFRRLSWGPSG